MEHEGDVFINACRTRKEKLKYLFVKRVYGYALFDPLRRQLPSHFINAGVAEQNMVGVAAGMAKQGLYPIIYGLLTLCPFACLNKLRLIFVAKIFHFKMYKSCQLKELDLICEKFDIVAEVIYKLSLIYPNLKIKEIPFSFKKRMFGETKLNLPPFMFNYLVTIVRLRMMKVAKS